LLFTDTTLWSKCLSSKIWRGKVDDHCHSTPTLHAWPRAYHPTRLLGCDLEEGTRVRRTMASACWSVGNATPPWTALFLNFLIRENCSFSAGRQRRCLVSRLPMASRPQVGSGGFLITFSNTAWSKASGTIVMAHRPTPCNFDHSRTGTSLCY